MTEEEKVKIIEYLKKNLSPEEASNLEAELLVNDNAKQIFDSYSEMIKHIDLLYARKLISSEINKFDFNDEEYSNTQIIEKRRMKASTSNWLQYLIMVVISALVSWIVFSLAFKSETSDEVENNKSEELIEEKVDKEDNRLTVDSENTGIDIMGIAINRTGFYLLPYSVNDLEGVFGSNQSMTNNLPLTIVWDDKELGYAVATFADENLEKLSSIPYSFSKQDYFLGEEMFLVFSSKSKLTINSGIVIEDDPNSAFMKLHLNLPGNVYGAVVMDENGSIVGICERQDDDGSAKVVKSKELHKMVSEMNLDKGVSYISMPSQNYLRSKSNTQRIESLKPFIAWFNSK